MGLTRAGAAGLEGHLGRFERDFDYGPLVRRFFRCAGADPIYAAPVRLGTATPTGSWVLHVRLPPRLEDSFGFNRQFVVYCLNVTDLQSRAVTQLKRLIESAEHSVSSDFAIIFTNDNSGREKIRDWAVERSDGITVLATSADQVTALLSGADPGQALPQLLHEVLAAQNLFDERTPVHGETFFGRGADLREIDQIVFQGGRHVGVFGLRRIGKTSLLFELADRLRRRPDVTPIYIDLETSSAARSAAHVAYRVLYAIAGVLSERSGMSKAAARRALSVPDAWEAEAPEQFVTRLATSLHNIMTEGTLSDSRIVLILDEAEILLPHPDRPTSYAVDFLRALRGVAQETQRLTLVLAGVNATPCESPVIGDEDNPLFGLLALRYLGPLEEAACDDMIRVVGRRMRMRWDPPARKMVTEYSAAHPLLARLVASDVANDFPERPSRPSQEMVQAVLRRFHSRHADVFRQMMESLRRYYPEEIDVLKVIAAGDKVFTQELLSDDPGILNHLTGYGVVDPDSLTIAVPAFAAWLRVHAGD
jgi:hypothetical protein